VNNEVSFNTTIIIIYKHTTAAAAAAGADVGRKGKGYTYKLSAGENEVARTLGI